VQHEAAVTLHRAAGKHRHVAQPLVFGRERELVEHFGHAHLERTVDHESERAAFVVLAHERDAVREVRVGERRHRDQQLVVEVIARAHGASIGPGHVAGQSAKTGQTTFFGEARNL